MPEYSFILRSLNPNRMILRFLRIILLFICFAQTSFSQTRLKGASDIGKLRWWLGIKTGATFSQVKVLEKFSVLSGQNNSDEDKKYNKSFRNMGQTIGVIFGYALGPNFLITFQPAYSNYKYGYKTFRTWRNLNGDSYSLSTSQIQRIGYIEFPVLFLFRVPVGHFEPYINLGAYYGKFVGGRKKLTYQESITEGGLSQPEDEKSETLGLSEYMMKSQMGLAGGLGISYTIQYFRIGLELSYKTGQYNLTDVKARYSNKHMLSKYYEVPDDIRLNQMDITLNMFMPVDNLIHLHSSQKSKAGRK